MVAKAQPLPTDDEFYDSLRVFINAAIIAETKDRMIYGKAYDQTAATVPRMGEAQPGEREG